MRAQRLVLPLQLVGSGQRFSPPAPARITVRSGKRWSAATAAGRHRRGALPAERGRQGVLRHRCTVPGRRLVLPGDHGRLARRARRIRRREAPRALGLERPLGIRRPWTHTPVRPWERIRRPARRTAPGRGRRRPSQSRPLGTGALAALRLDPPRSGIERRVPVARRTAGPGRMARLCKPSPPACPGQPDLDQGGADVRSRRGESGPPRQPAAGLRGNDFASVRERAVRIAHHRRPCPTTCRRGSALRAPTDRQEPSSRCQGGAPVPATRRIGALDRLLPRMESIQRPGTRLPEPRCDRGGFPHVPTFAENEGVAVVGSDRTFVARRWSLPRANPEGRPVCRSTRAWSVTDCFSTMPSPSTL